MEHSLRRYIDWSELCHLVKDPYHLLYIAVRADEAGLKRMQTAYPTIFRSEPSEHADCVPLSLLRRLCDEHCAKDGEDQSSFQDMEALTPLGIIAIQCAHATSPYYRDGKTILMPQAVIDQYPELVERTKGNAYFPYDLATLTIDDIIYYLGWANPDGTSSGKRLEEYDLYLFPTDRIFNDTGEVSESL